MAPWKTIWHNHSLTAARGKCSISSPTSTLFWEPGHRFSAIPDLPNVYEGSVWGASVISAPEASQGLRVSNQSCGVRRVTVRGQAMALLLPVHREENHSSTREEYLVWSKRPLEHFPPFCLWHYISIYKRNPQYLPGYNNMLNILICQYVGQKLF